MDGKKLLKTALAALMLLSISSLSAADNVTYYEHTTNVFNATAPLGVMYSTTVAVPAYSEIKAIVFTKDVAEPNDLVVVGDQNVSFYGWFAANKPADKDDIFINWQIVDYNPDTGNEIQICRSPTSLFGKQITSTTPKLLTAACPTTTTYVVPAGNKLRVNIYAFNRKKTDVRRFVHYWDTNARDSRYVMQHFGRGSLSTDLIAPATDLSLAQGTVFNATCQVQCTGGSCANTQVFIEFSNQSSNFTSWKSVAADSDTIVLNGSETNPHPLGTINATTNTTFVLKANTQATNQLRCRAATGYSAVIGATTRTITVTPPDVRGVATERPAYKLCDRVYFRIFAYDPAGSPVDRVINYKIIDTQNTVREDQNVSLSSGSFSGNYLLYNPMDRGEWTIKAMSVVTRGLGYFIVGEGNAQPWRIVLAFDKNKVRYQKGEDITVNSTVYSMQGLGLEGLLSGNKLRLYVDGTEVTSSTTDLGQGLYRFTYNTSQLAGPVHTVRAVAKTVGSSTDVTTVRAFYLVSG